MNTNLKALASLVLASAVVASYAQTSTGSASTTKKRTATHKAAAKPSVESQIEELRNDMNSQRGQIDTLKQQLADRDAQLQQAQQAAAGRPGCCAASPAGGTVTSDGDCGKSRSLSAACRARSPI